MGKSRDMPEDDGDSSRKWRARAMRRTLAVLVPGATLRAQPGRATDEDDLGQPSRGDVTSTMDTPEAAVRGTGADGFQRV